LNPRDAGATSSFSRRFEPVEAIAVGWQQNHFVLQVREIERGRVRHVRPVRRGQIQILLQNKIVEGTIQESLRSGLAGARFNCGVGVDCEIQIPPPLTTAANLFPSADEATEVAPAKMFVTHFAPKSIET
jgi:hypothetical protein